MQQLKLLSQALAGCTQLLPRPASLALFAASVLIHLSAVVFENIRAKRETQKGIQQLRGQVLFTSELIRRHGSELPADETWCRLVERFWALVTELEEFSSDFDREVSALWVVWSSFGKVHNNETFHELSRSLNAVFQDFQSHLNNINAAKRHKLIRHCRLRALWKYRLADPFEANWAHFWSVFLDEFPTLRQLFAGSDGSHWKKAFEAKAETRNSTTVSPRDINKIFQPPEATVEQIIYVLLGLSDSDSLPQPERALTAVSSEGQILYLNGYWQRQSHKGKVELDLYIANNGKVFGAGRDEIGEHTYRGYLVGNRVLLVKQYLHKYSVQYDGQWITKSRILGVWSIGNYRSGGFDFETTLPGRTHRFDESSVSRRYNGFYVNNGEQLEMSVELVFTRKGSIYGNGSDMIGASTWLGTFNAYNASVYLVKQYDLQHAVVYQGTILSCESEIRFQGTWKRVGAQGTFQLTTKA